MADLIHNPWLILVLALLLLAGAAEAGYRLGLRSARTAGSSQAQITTLQAAILGFLALILGFSYSVSQSRFDARRQLLVREANAIGTTYLRAQMLPSPYRQDIIDLLAQYAAVRLPTRRGLPQALAESERLQQAIWAQAVAAAEVETRPAVVALFTQSLNEMIDVHTMRLAAYLYQAPPLLLVLLHLSAALAIGVMGYASALHASRNLVPMTAMMILMATVLFLIVDLERPSGGIMRTNPRAMQDVQEMLNQATGR